MIKFRVYLHTVEIKIGKHRGINGPEDLTEERIQNELLDSPDVVLKAEFDTEEEAVKYLNWRWPVFDIGRVEGMGVKFIPVAGAWIEEYDDDEYVGVVGFSRMPEPDGD